MVLLTMTPAIVQALEEIHAQSKTTPSKEDKVQIATSEEPYNPASEPSLLQPLVGKPIAHGQVINISKQLKALGISPHHLDTLLRGSTVYTLPPPPKPEPVYLSFLHPPPVQSD
jgi:hypothetical protein